MSVFYLGFTTELRPDYKAFLAPVQANKTFKDAAKIAEDITKREAAQAEEALLLPITARITECTLLDKDGVTIVSRGLGSGGARNALQALVHARQSLVAVYGFNVRAGLAIMAAQLAGEEFRPVPGDICFRHFPQEQLGIDPYQQIVGADEKHLTLPTVYKHFVHEDLPAGFETNTADRAKAAMLLTKAAGV